MKLLFFVDPAWRRDGIAHIPLLYPFWGNALTERTPIQRALFEAHHFDTSLYGITEDAEEAHLALMPYSHNTALAKCPELLALCDAWTKRHNKPVLIDGVGDIEHEVSIHNALVLRYGGYRFERKKNEIHIPPYADDLLLRFCGGTLALREKTSEKPVVGFAGWSSLTFSQRVRTHLKAIPIHLKGLLNSDERARHKGVLFRAHAIALLKKSTLVQTRIVERPSYSGHIATASAKVEDLQKQFVDNLLSSDYCLDVRGDANASIRLFEILSLGRIPVIVDTERNLPFDDVVEYATFSLRIDFRDLAMLPERIAAFHARLLPEEFRDMQRRARDAYARFFRVDALTTELMREIRVRADALRKNSHE